MDLTGHIWGYYICVYTNACMHALKIYGKRQKKFEGIQGGLYGGFGGRKRKREML